MAVVAFCSTLLRCAFLNALHATRLQLRVMGVDLMQFSINTARARFIRLGLEFYDSTSSIHRDDSNSAPCVGFSCTLKSFPIACVGSGLDMPWIHSSSFNKYISVYPINHFDDEGSEKLVSVAAFPRLNMQPAILYLASNNARVQICEAHRVLVPGGVAFFGMINRDEGTFLGPFFRNESWWTSVARRCGFENVRTTSNFTEWRGGPARYHAYLTKGIARVDESEADQMQTSLIQKHLKDKHQMSSNKE